MNRYCVPKSFSSHGTVFVPQLLVKKVTRKSKALRENKVQESGWQGVKKKLKELKKEKREKERNSQRKNQKKKAMEEILDYKFVAFKY